MVIGGQAVLLYGEPRLTRDIDITLGLDVDATDRVLAATASIPLKPLIPDITEFVRSTRVLPLQHVESGIRVDLIFSFSSYEETALKRVTTRTILGRAVCYASVEDVIIHKMVAGRPRDLEDVRSILTRNAARDDTYVRRWLSEFETVTGKSLGAEYARMLEETE